MSLPQPGIFAEGSNTHVLLEYRVKDGVSDTQLRTAVSAAVAALATGDSNKYNVVWGFAAACWARLSGAVPLGLKAFTPVGKAPNIAPATQRDILLWLHGTDAGHNFDGAQLAHRFLSEVAVVELDKTGFLYHDARDLTGFIDGTENPEADERRQVALIPEGQVGAGGSFMLTQQWVHKLRDFGALNQTEQENVIGRTKPDSVELSGERMPNNSHVSRSDVKINGVGQKLYRRSVPYGGVVESGLYFLSFSAEISRYDAILASMFGMTEDGIHDRLTDFSTPVTGSYWFSPSLLELSEIGKD
ncbi:Dyp-type peroxidase [Spongiibacter sp. KMU-158]|uniref:Dyp-type peroxidase n=1 Tax=Spongiibacter pelagi TaxID=2760804 RepID=A0A927C196_9GAMM|nr:Dyp-type peroxidase [Spongiibacter pelagi]MBD2857665.1 Dyp-type peroxidase [Spongiibacter pelagi]